MELLVVAAVLTCADAHHIAQGAILSPMSNAHVNEIIVELQQVSPPDCELPTID